MVQQNPNHYISRFLNLANNTAYVKFYRDLERNYINPTTCVSALKRAFYRKWEIKIRDAAREDEDSKLGTYLFINPTLSKPTYERKLEFQRVCITRYRTGSHNLRIEKDRRLPNSNRADRICSCNTGVQSIKHVLLRCPLLGQIREKYDVMDIESGISNENFLLEMESILGIRQ